MWTQTVDPFGSLWLSALVAAIPIVVFLAGLVVFKLSGITAALVALATQIVVAMLPFHMPATAVAGAGLLVAADVVAIMARR